MNSDIFIPVRLASSRLPRKQLKKIDGIPVLKHLIDRLQTSKKKRNIIVCTTDQSYDNNLVEFLEKEEILYFRGSEKDILMRFLEAAKHFETDIIIDVEGDKIYTDPFFVDKIISIMENSDYDYAEGSISDEDNMPIHGIHGFVPAGIRTSALKKVCKLKTTDITDTGYKEFFRNEQLFKCKRIFPEPNLKFPKNLRLTLDYPEDFELAKKVFAELGNNFHLNDILKLFESKPDLLKITEPLIEKWNKDYERNLVDLSLKQNAN